MEDFEFLNKIERDPGNLIKALQAVQGLYGFVSDDAVLAVSAYFGVPEAEIEGVLSFYAQFKRVKPGRFRIAICDGTACHIKGAPQIRQWVSAELGIRPGETDAEGRFSLEVVACLGCCSLAPVMSINGRVYGKLDRKGVSRILKEYAAK